MELDDRFSGAGETNEDTTYDIVTIIGHDSCDSDGAIYSYHTFLLELGCCTDSRLAGLIDHVIQHDSYEPQLPILMLWTSSLRPAWPILGRPRPEEGKGGCAA